ncbi:MAG: phage tail protein [Burkholderiales bacterium]|nr:phage tail protein [Burkholderiales bacterium]
MSTPFLGEIRPVSFAFAPKGWALCNGQLLPINQNQALFSLLGTQYGGNGQTNFALPDLRGRAPMHVGPASSQGQPLGEEAHTLNANEVPAHQHRLQASADLANMTSPGGTVLAAKPRGGRDIYAPAASPTTPLNPDSIGATGAGQAHDNMQPFLALNFVIALQGIFPSHN